MIWLELCTTYSSSSPVVTNTSIILCFNKHQLTQVHLENVRVCVWTLRAALEAPAGRTQSPHVHYQRWSGGSSDHRARTCRCWETEAEVTDTDSLWIRDRDRGRESHLSAKIKLIKLHQYLCKFQDLWIIEATGNSSIFVKLCWFVHVALEMCTFKSWIILKVWNKFASLQRSTATKYLDFRCCSLQCSSLLLAIFTKY